MISLSRVHVATLCLVAFPGSVALRAQETHETPEHVHTTQSFNLIDYGADATGERDSSPAFDRIMAHVGAVRHVHITIPAGAYRLDRRVILAASGNDTNYGIRVSGAGEDVTELRVTNTEGGLAFRGVGMNRLTCTIADLSLVAVRETAGVALAFDTANPGDHHSRQFTLENILIRGERFDRGSFSAGVEVRNAWYPSLDNVKVTGLQVLPAATPDPLACGILLEDCYSPMLTGCYVWGGVHGLIHRSRLKRPEDGIVRDSYFVGCVEGILIDLVSNAKQWAEPGFHISDCHVNYRDRGVVVRGVRQATISSALFYCSDRTGTQWYRKGRHTINGGDGKTPRPYETRDIDLEHASDIVISHNIFTEPATPNRVAIRIGKASGSIMVSANQFNMSGTAIKNESAEPSYASNNVFGGRPNWAARLTPYIDPAGALQTMDFKPLPRP